VRKSHLLVAILGCVLIAGLAVYTATAQGPGRAVTAAQTGAPRIAVVDIGYIFKMHTGFKAKKADLESQMKQASDRLKQEQETLRKMMQDLQKMQPGTEQYKQFEEELARRNADLQIRFQLQDKEFARKEASIYHTVYLEIEEEVRYLASQSGLDAVLRFNGDTVDPDQPAQVMRNVNKLVVWFNEGLDITPEILRRLNVRYGAQTATPTAPGQRTRHGVPSPTINR
jgi:Skp family chaperone for outer membrane proteins